MHQTQTDCPHVAHRMPLQKVKKSWLPTCVSATVRCNKCDHIFFLSFPTLSRRCRACQWWLQPPPPPPQQKKGQHVGIISHRRTPLETMKHGSFHRFKLTAALVHSDHALADLKDLKEHVVKHFAHARMSKMWEALAAEREHVPWVNEWCVLALLKTYCPAEAAVEQAISLHGRSTTSMCLLSSMCMVLHSDLPPLQQWAKGWGVAVAQHLAAHARFNVRLRHRLSRQLHARGLEGCNRPPFT